MLLLFDIDATLLTTSGGGAAAMHDACRAEFGTDFSIEGIAFAGRLDPLILSDMLRRNGLGDTPEHHARIRVRYAAMLRERLHAPGAARALPGVHRLLDSLAPRAEQGSVIMGLLTGNFSETGTMKLLAAGIDPARFTVAAWGEDAAHGEQRPARREDLVPVATNRAVAAGARAGTFTIIGDTPHDVRCALAHGGRCLAVATGRYSAADLAAAGAHRVVPDLDTTADVLEFLLDGRRPEK